MGSQPSNIPRLSGPGLFFARLVWLLLVTASIGLFLIALLPRYRQLLADPYALQSGLEQLGLTTQLFAFLGTSLDILVAICYFSLAVLIFLKGSREWVALLFSLSTAMFIISVLPVTSVLPQVNAAWQVPYLLLRGVGFASFFAALLLFPDGRFVPRWSRFVLLLVIFYVFLWPIFPTLAPITSLDFSISPNPGVILLMITGFILMAVFQVYRYRYVSTPLQRQQTRWVVLGVTSEIIIFILVILPGAFWTPIQTSTRVFVLYFLFGIPLILLSTILFPLSVALAVFRYRLWDIDLVVRRTLVYSLLTGLLTLLYFAIVTLLQAVLSAMGIQPSAFVIVLTTLLIAFLFNPLRQRIQAFIDQRFYRQKYDAEKALAAFAEAARSETDLEQISIHLLKTIQDSLHPDGLSLWLSVEQRQLTPGKEI